MVQHLFGRVTEVLRAHDDSNPPFLGEVGLEKVIEPRLFTLLPLIVVAVFSDLLGKPFDKGDGVARPIVQGEIMAKIVPRARTTMMFERFLKPIVSAVPKELSVMFWELP